ncbi:MAG: DUF5320 domain-containing protein [Desulfobacterales bacterium]
MPGFNGTGPFGAGSKTGGGFGYCAPTAVGAAPYPRGTGRGAGGTMGGRGLQRGFRGGGRGARCWRGAGFYGAPAVYYPPSATDEASYLKSEADQLKARLDAVERRMAEIDTRSGPPEV